MALPIKIQGRCLTGGLVEAVLRSNGSLLTSVLTDLSATATAGVDDTPVTLISPKAGQVVVVTGGLISTNRNVGNDGANVDVYYAESDTSTDTTNELIGVVDFAKNSAIATTPIVLEVPIGNYVLLKTNDNSATASLFYHFESD